MIFMELILISQFSCLYIAEPFFKWPGAWGEVKKSLEFIVYFGYCPDCPGRAQTSVSSMCWHQFLSQIFWIVGPGKGFHTERS